MAILSVAHFQRVASLSQYIQAKARRGTRSQVKAYPIPKGLEKYVPPAHVDVDMFYSLLNAYITGDGYNAGGTQAMTTDYTIWAMAGANKEQLKAALYAVKDLIKKEHL